MDGAVDGTRVAAAGTTVNGPRSHGDRSDGPVDAPPVTDRIVVVVRVGRDEVELAADELFALGASAVGEIPVDPRPVGDPDGDGVDLVADLPADRVAGLTRAHRLGPVDGDAGGRPASGSPHEPVHVAGFVLVPVDAGVAGSEGAGTDDAAAEAVLPTADPDRAVLLDALSAFGSGTHETTRLCVAEVVRLVRPGCRVVDVGSGNGVLSVVAARCGASAVVAIDVDPAARAATATAAVRNGVADRVVVDERGVDELAAGSGSFTSADLVVANVLVGVVEEHAPGLVDLVAPGGSLVVSGALAPQVGRVVAAVRAAAGSAGRSANLRSASAQGEWRAVVFRIGHRSVKGP